MPTQTTIAVFIRSFRSTLVSLYLILPLF